MATTSIEWSESVLNALAGCSLVSAGCRACYAMRMAARLEAMGQPKYVGLTRKVNGHAVWTGKVTFDPAALRAPLKRRKPTMYFVNSMSDLFHEDVTDDWIDQHFATFALCPQHTFQILTKRPERMSAYLAGDAHRRSQDAAAAMGWITKGDGFRYAAWPWPLANVWCGFSAENQEWFDRRWAHAQGVAEAGWLTWCSMEPLIGPIRSAHAKGLAWVVSGGESGPGARPCEVAWLRQIREDCKVNGAARFIKQLGSHPVAEYGHDYAKQINGEHGVSAYTVAHKAWPTGPAEPLGSRPSIRSDGRILLNDGKGGDMAEWAPDLRVRAFPVPAPVAPQRAG